MNCKLLKFFVIPFLLLAFNMQASAQQNSDQEESTDVVEDIVTDTAITKNTFDDEKNSVTGFKHNKDFSYIAYLDSLLRKSTLPKTDTVSIDTDTGKKRRAGSMERPNNFLNSYPLKIFLWAVAFIFISLIIYKLFFADNIFAKRNIAIVEEQPRHELVGLNEYSEYNPLIRDAEQKNNYNLSTRYLYLQTLKRLTDKGLIQFSPDKTNYSYVQELSGKNYHHDFASLTLSYEYVWYGKHIISETRYRRLKEDFISFNKKFS